jgi:hypothetical protein
VAALETGTQVPPAAGPTHRMLTIGAPRSPLNKALIGLLCVIASPFGVRVDVASASTYAIVYGVPGDLDQVESLYATAAVMMLERGQRHVRSREWEGSSYRATRSGPARPVTAPIARNAFCLGFTQRIGALLAEAATQAHSGPGSADWLRPGSADQGSPGGPKGHSRVDVALRARDVAVTEYYRRTTRARGSWRPSVSRAGSATSSRRAGERAAEEFRRSRLGHGGPVRQELGAR